MAKQKKKKFIQNDDDLSITYCDFYSFPRVQLSQKLLDFQSLPLVEYFSPILR